MRKNTKQTYTALAVIIIVGAVIWLFRSKPTTVVNEIKNSDVGQQNSQNPNPAPSPTSSSEVWTGTLKLSDTSAKGNFMLVTSDRKIYFRSSRNLSALVGKQVDLSYQGTLQNFVVGSITLSATQ
jgi:hypothetical protein